MKDVMIVHRWNKIVDIIDASSDRKYQKALKYMFDEWILPDIEELELEPEDEGTYKEDCELCGHTGRVIIEGAKTRKNIKCPDCWGAKRPKPTKGEIKYKQLVENCKKGDTKSIEEFIRKYGADFELWYELKEPRKV